MFPSADPNSRVLPFPRKRRISVGRVAGVALLCCACVFAASMTSEANRNYFVKGMRYLVGDDTRIIAGNDGENENINYAEQDAIKEIETKLNVEMPEFYYRPPEFEFLNYEMSASTGIAQIEYKYYENIISLLFLLFLFFQITNRLHFPFSTLQYNLIVYHILP